MRKNFFKPCRLLLSLFLVGQFFWGNAVAASLTLDQSNSTSASDGSLTIYNHQRIGQVFKPTQPQIARVSVHIRNAGENLGMTITKQSTGSGVVTVLGQASVEGWNTFNFAATNIELGQNYVIYLTTAGNTAQWLYNSNGYANGCAIINSVQDCSKDFGFMTYGYPASTANDATQNAAVNNTGLSPSSNISTAFKPPSELKAVDVSNSNTPGIKLNWKASTSTDITGYKVFRKDAKNDYRSVAILDKSKLEYIDKNVSFNIEYTFMVRAYKGDQESTNSNEAKITPKKSKMNISSVSEPEFWKDPKIIATLVILILAIVGFITYYVIHRKKQAGVEKENLSTKGKS